MNERRKIVILLIEMKLIWNKIQIFDETLKTNVALAKI